MNIKRHHLIGLAFAVVIVALTANAARLLAVKRAAPRATAPAHAHGGMRATPVPYTVVLREVVTDPEGARHEASTLTTAATASGWLVQMLGREGSGSRRIHMTEGVVVQTKDDLKLRSTTAAADDFGHWHRLPASNCLANLYGEPATAKAEEFVREEVRDGYRAAKIKYRNTTRWFALDVGCALIGTFTDFGKGRTSEQRLVSLTTGHPSPLLVDLSDFVEGPPSLQSPVSANDRCQGDCVEKLKKHLARLDAAYYARRPRR